MLEIVMLGTASFVIIGLILLGIKQFTEHTEETMVAIGIICALCLVILMLGVIAKYLLTTFGAIV